MRTLLTSFSTTLLVAGLAAAWAVASPLAAGCAQAVSAEQMSASPNESAQFVAQINDLRRSKGLGDLAVSGNLASIAQDWSVTMASQDSIFHRSDLSEGVTINWRRLGENVGVGPNVNDLMQAFIASAGHYKNLVDPSFTHIGVGTVRTTDGLIYTAHEFAAVEGASTAPPATVAPAPPKTTAPKAAAAPRVTKPRVTAPPTTAAPTTTTTEPPVSVERSTADNDELQNGGTDDQQQQQYKNKGRCRAHGGQRVVASAAAAAVSRLA